MNPHAFIVGIWTYNLRQRVDAGCRIQCDLIISWCYLLLIGYYPDLQELDLFIGMRILLTMKYACSGAHHLDIALFYHSNVAHAVLMTQIAFQRNRDDFHIVVRMLPKSHSAGNRVVIQYAQSSEMHPVRIIIMSKAECMVGIQPTVISMSP